MRRDYLLIIGIASLFFLPLLGAVHLFDWDEINFAECSREMVLTGDWFRPQIDFEPFWEKPPMFIWMQAISMTIFGVGEFAARFPNAICGILTLLVLYKIGRRLHDRMFAWVWVLAWLGSLLPHFYFRSGIIDPWFNLFIFTGLYGFIEFRWQFFVKKQETGFWKRYYGLFLGGWLLGLAVLTKGPTALLITGLVIGVYWARYRFKGKGYLKHSIFFALAAVSSASVWFLVEYLLHGPWFIQTFLEYQVRLFATPDAGHGGFWGYHVIVLLVGCFPVSVFALANLWGDRQSEDELLESDTLESCMRSDFGTWMQILFWVVLILFSIVRTKIVHYSSLAYFPITYLGAVTIWRAIKWQVSFRYIPILLPVLGILLGGAVMLLPYVGSHIDQLKPLFAKDPFALGNLEAAVSWSWWQGLPGFVLLAGSIVASFLWLRKRHWDAVQMLFISGTAFVSGAMIFLVGNIEGYSQRAAIEFYESKSQEDCFIKPVAFKSYAHLFYAGKQCPGADSTLDDYQNLAHGNPGKPVYFVAKVSNTDELPGLTDVVELYRKNGFVFYKRTLVPK